MAEWNFLDEGVREELVGGRKKQRRFPNKAYRTHMCTEQAVQMIRKNPRLPLIQGKKIISLSENSFADAYRRTNCFFCFYSPCQGGENV